MNRFLLPVSVVVAFAIGMAVASLPPSTVSRAVPGTAARVVALSTAAVEIIFALGAEDRLVGVTDYAVYPPAAVAIENCGGWTNANFEVITALGPDLIVIQGKHETAKIYASRRGVNIISLNSSSIDDVYDGIECLGTALGVPDSAGKLRARIKDALENVSSAVDGRARVPVLIVTGRMVGTIRQISTCGGDSFLSHLVEIAGGKNIFKDTKGYLTISREELLARGPEVIIELRPGESLNKKRLALLKAEYAALESLPAVQSGRVHVIQYPSALTAGPRIHEIAKMIAELLHPEINWDKIKRVENSGR